VNVILSSSFNELKNAS